jgi:hypothetical protein
MDSECLGCERLSTEHVVMLNGGRVVCSSCPSWALECEAKTVLKKPLEDRRAYLDAIEKVRGKAGADALRAAVTALWSKK